MAASSVQNPAAQAESKSSKKKKAKAEAAAPVSAVKAQETGSPAPESSNGDGGYESPYIKELYKSIRNVNKKIANASKVDNVLAENPNKSLDELVASRKINADQKAQILKKPALQSSLTQLEEQIAQYKKFDAEYKSKAQAEKAELEKAFAEKAEANLSEALATAKAEAVANAAKEQHENMLVLSQFLRLAAARRADEEADATSDENMALEGVLLQVYSGDETAVEAMIKLIRGADEPTHTTTGEPLTTTYASIKAAAIAQAPPTMPLEEAAEETPAVETTSYPIESDPTVANAGLTEIDDIPAAPTTNGHADPAAEMASVGIPQNSGIDEGASNAAAESHWDVTNNDLSASQEWVDVKVPRDISETDTGVTATPAANQPPQQTTASWADESNDQSAPAAAANDGFHEVQRSRGGQNRGRGGRGGEGHRGRGGYRGDGNYRGRGRGGPRGGPREGGAPRGQRRAEE